MSDGICNLCKHPKVVPLGPNGLCHFHQKDISKAGKSLLPVQEKSEKQSKRDRAYSKLAAAYKAVHSVCEAQLIGCTKQTTEVHHKSGRIGDKLTDTSLFLAVCHACHRQIEESPLKAKALNLSLSRLTKESE